MRDFHQLWALLCVFGAASLPTFSAAVATTSHDKASLRKEFVQAMDRAVGKKKNDDLFRSRLTQLAVPAKSHPGYVRSQQFSTEGHNNNRQLEEYQEYGIDLSEYALKYIGCSNIRTWSDDLAAENNNNGNGSVLKMDKFVVLRLCPRDSCSNYNQYGCLERFGDYLIPMEIYLQTMAETFFSQYQEYCETCYECMANNANDDAANANANANDDAANYNNYNDDGANNYNNYNDDGANNYNNYNNDDGNGNGGRRLNDDAWYNYKNYMTDDAAGNYYYSNRNNYDYGRGNNNNYYNNNYNNNNNYNYNNGNNNNNNNYNYNNGNNNNNNNNYNYNYNNGNNNNNNNYNYNNANNNNNNNYYNNYDGNQGQNENKDCNNDYSSVCASYKTACQDYSNLGFDLEDYFECAEFNIGNSAAYLGPHCASDGKTISMGIFKDEYCNEYKVDLSQVSSYMGVNDNGLDAYYSDNCISCLASDGYTLDVDNNDDGYNAVSDICGALYGESAKCNRYMGDDGSYASSNQESQESTVCNFIQNLLTNSYDEYGEIVLEEEGWKTYIPTISNMSKMAKWQKLALSISILSTLAMFMVACYLYREIKKRRYAWFPRGRKGYSTGYPGVKPTPMDGRVHSGIIQGRSHSSGNFEMKDGGMLS